MKNLEKISLQSIDYCSIICSGVSSAVIARLSGNNGAENNRGILEKALELLTQVKESREGPIRPFSQFLIDFHKSNRQSKIEEMERTISQILRSESFDRESAEQVAEFFGKAAQTLKPKTIFNQQNFQPTAI